MTFYSQLKIRFGDIGRAGIVYYPRFMHYFHVALEEFFASELEIEFSTSSAWAMLARQRRITVIQTSWKVKSLAGFMVDLKTRKHQVSTSNIFVKCLLRPDSSSVTQHAG